MRDRMTRKPRKTRRKMYSAGLSATPKASPAHRKWVAAISLMTTLADTMPAPRQACRGQTMPSANELRNPRIGPAKRIGRRATSPAGQPPTWPARRFQKANPANSSANRTKPPAPPAIRPRRMPPPGSGKAAKPRAAATKPLKTTPSTKRSMAAVARTAPMRNFSSRATSHERTKGLMPRGIMKLAKYPAMMVPNKRHVPMALSLSRIWRHFHARTNCSAAMARGTRSTNPISAWTITCRRRWKSMRQRTQEMAKTPITAPVAAHHLRLGFPRTGEVRSANG